MVDTGRGGGDGSARSGTGEQPPVVEHDLRERVARFVTAEVMPCEPVLDAGGPAAAAVLGGLRDRARSQGLWALPLPRELGGGGLPLRAYAALAEAEGASDHGPAALGSAPCSMSPC